MREALAEKDHAAIASRSLKACYRRLFCRSSALTAYAWREMVAVPTNGQHAGR